MDRCEDFPCCGHEMGCCPSYNESGVQLDMKCTCGASIPVNNRFSLCDSCLELPDPFESYGPYGPEDEIYEGEEPYYDGPIDD